MERHTNIYAGRPEEEPQPEPQPLSSGIQRIDFHGQVKKQAILGTLAVLGIGLITVAILWGPELLRQPEIQEEGIYGSEAEAPAPPDGASDNRLGLDDLAPNLSAHTDLLEPAVETIDPEETLLDTEEETAGSDPEARRRAERLVTRAQASGQNGLFDEAIQLLESARSIDPTVPELDQLLGYAYLQTRDYRAAIQYLDSALRADPENPDLLIQIAAAQAGTGNTQEAILLLRQALDLERSHPQALINLARLEINAELFSSAADRLRRLLELFPDRAEAHDLMGLTHLNMNRLDRAYDSFQKAQSLEPSNPVYFIHLAALTVVFQSPGEAERMLREALIRIPMASILEELNNPLLKNLKRRNDYARFLREVTSLTPSLANPELPQDHDSPNDARP
jgi:cytochrome c-type biogenesis protein CcmH/NrfG